MKFKKIFGLLFCLISCLFSISAASCSYTDYQNGNIVFSNTYTVTFVYNNGYQNSTYVVDAGNTVSAPKDPIKKNYTFLGWYIDYNLTNRYDFSRPVTQNLTLYAKYEINAVSLLAEINANTIKGALTIYNKCYLPSNQISLSQGSGFCFHIQNGYYYILTNRHVVYKNSSSTKQELSVEDYKGNNYEARLYSSDRGEAISSSHDLAVLYFKPSSTDVINLDLGKASANPSVGDDVISISTPKGQKNTISFGKVMAYCDGKLKNADDEDSKIEFQVISHTAQTNNGSSGSAILNSNLQVVGVNYAKNTNYGFAIPIEKVLDFLNIYIISSN